MGTLCSCTSARNTTEDTTTKMSASADEIDAAVQVVVSELTEKITPKFVVFL